MLPIEDQETRATLGVHVLKTIPIADEYLSYTINKKW